MTPPDIYTYAEQVNQAASFIRSRFSEIPDIVIQLGTGLGGLAEKVQAQERLRYSDIPFFPQSTVTSHDGALIAGDPERQASAYSLRQIPLLRGIFDQGSNVSDTGNAGARGKNPDHHQRLRRAQSAFRPRHHHDYQGPPQFSRGKPVAGSQL